MRDALRRMPACTLLALTASAVIFIFYCIPASKRSVYLMPMYPFVAWFISEMLIWMSGRRPASVRVFGDILASLAMLLLTVFMAIRFGLVPDSIAGHGKSTAQTAAMLESLRTFGGARAWLFAAMSPICAVIWWARIRHRAAGAWLPLSTALLAVSLYMSLSGCYQPAVLQAKSVKNMTGEMTHLYPNMPGKVYEFLAAAENAKGNPVHFFEVNFYMGDKVRNFRVSSRQKATCSSTKETQPTTCPASRKRDTALRKSIPPTRDCHATPRTSTASPDKKILFTS